MGPEPDGAGLESQQGDDGKAQTKDAEGLGDQLEAESAVLNKYLTRVVETLEERNPKLPRTEVRTTPATLTLSVQENMNQMAQAANQHREAFIHLIRDIDCFELEDRKLVQSIVTELHIHQTDLIEEALKDDATKIVDNLLDKYADRGRVTFIGNYLRMFTDSPVLIVGWLSLANMRKLFATITDDDFNVEADAMQTLQVSHKTFSQLRKHIQFQNFKCQG